jgi:hypothetical protein
MRKSSVPPLLTLSIILLLAVLPLPRVEAGDIGPKPEMVFNFAFPPGSDLKIESGELLQCDTAECGDAQPLPELGPQGFACDDRSCHSTAYSYAPYSRLRITLSDGRVLESNSFAHESLSVEYRVTMKDRGLVVDQAVSRFRPNPVVLMALVIGGVFYFLLAAGLLAIHILRAGQGRGGAEASPRLYLVSWIVMAPALVASLLGFTGSLPMAIPLTLIIESVAALIYASLAGVSRRSFLTVALLANIFTVVPFWFIFGALYPGFSIPALLGAEGLVWLVESGVIFGALRGRVTLRAALLFSLVANLLSLVTGLLLPI